ncbi:MAG: A/G-specific adenine glycosylase [Eubacteriales bacterium]|nr:A/G-specific adenine glycosylase [Eubacteriales bacterium]
MTLQHKLLDWYMQYHRKLPFRESHDPYNIWISEIMLQQTQMDTVIPYYERFMARFPTVTELANAQEEEVFKMWEGLGYYSRARNLIKCARIIEDDYDGVFPDDYEKALKLPGIGSYTAGAVLSIAYNLKHPAVDGNVMRVLSRIYKMEEDIASPKSKKIFEAKILTIMPDDPRHFNQALMELGALICTPKSPKCSTCPINSCCMAFEMDLQDRLPVKTQKQKNKNLHLAVAIIRQGDTILFTKSDKGLLSGLWGFPSTEGESKATVKEKLMTVLNNELKIEIKDTVEVGKEKHVFTHKTWLMAVYRITSDSRSVCQEKASIKETDEPYDFETAWIALDEIENYAISTAFRKVLKYL